MGSLIVIIHEIAINCKSQSKTQSILLGISANINVGSPRSLHSNIYQMIDLFKTFIIELKIFIYALCYLITTL